MRIGLIAPITHQYPPDGYGPWERVTHDLVERLVAEGIAVTLFAPRGSMTKADLVETVPSPLADAPGLDPRLAEELHLATAMDAAASGSFDLLHSHLHVHALTYSNLIPCPLLTTLHGAAWNRAHHPLLLRYASKPYVSLSARERGFLPELNYVATIPHGLDTGQFPKGPGGGGYLAFVGRIAPEKAPDLAIETAARSGMPLLMAGPLDESHRSFFDQVMAGKPRDVDYLGPLNREDLATLYAEAEALVMPLRWDEPFGLVVIEALACGTPVIAWDRGAMREIVVDGETGFVVNGVEEAVDAAARLERLDRQACRRDVELRFSNRRMARDHIEVYERLTNHTMADRMSPRSATANLVP